MMWPGRRASAEPSRVSDGAERREGSTASGAPAPPAPRGAPAGQQANPASTRKAVLRNGEWKVIVTDGRTRDAVLGAAAATPQPLSSVQKWQFALGQFGSAALFGLIGVQLVSFYLPPIDSSTGGRLLPVTFVSQGTIWGVFNVVSMIAAVCRLWDAVTDPLVANISDRLSSPHGRRIPCMSWGALPSCACCAMLFFPPVHAESAWNVAWLALVQTLFFMFFTLYCTPYGALLPELGHTPHLRLQLSTMLAVTFGLGSLAGAGASTIGRPFGLDPVGTVQAGALIVCAIACACMYFPVFSLSEAQHCAPSAACSIGPAAALRLCLSNPHFRTFTCSEFAFSFSNTLIMTGMPYYLETLLGVSAADYLMLTIGGFIALAFVLYYPVNLLARRYSKKPLVLFAFSVQILGFTLIALLGKPNDSIPPAAQLLAVGAVAALPMAILGVLPTAILGDIVVHATRVARRRAAAGSGRLNGQPPAAWHGCAKEADPISSKLGALCTAGEDGSVVERGQNTAGGGGSVEGIEGMFFAGRTFIQKLGTTIGVALMASLTSYGELGIRLSAVFGIALAIVTLLFFSRYDEATVLREGELERTSSRGGAHGTTGGAGGKDGAGSGSWWASHSSVGESARAEKEGWWARVGRVGRYHDTGGLPTSNTRDAR